MDDTSPDLSHITTPEQHAAWMLSQVDIDRATALTIAMRSSDDPHWLAARRELQRAGVGSDDVFVISAEHVEPPAGWSATTLVCTLLDEVGDKRMLFASPEHHPDDMVTPPLDTGASRGVARSVVEAIRTRC